MLPGLEGDKKKIGLSLQRVFHDLQCGKMAVDTTCLTNSFGWNSYESFMQHDVQEFSRVLSDALVCFFLWFIALASTT